MKPTNPTPRPSPDGSTLGVIEGHGPLLPHPCIGKGVTPHESIPPASLRRGRGYWAIRYWPARQGNGKIIKVVCFACDATWMGEWGLIHRENGDEVVLPVVDGGTVWRTERVYSRGGQGWKRLEARACTCWKGQRSRFGEQATREDVDAALEADQELTKAVTSTNPVGFLRTLAAKMSGSAGSWSNTRMPSTLPESPAEPPIPQGSDLAVEQEDDRGSESKISLDDDLPF